MPFNKFSMDGLIPTTLLFPIIALISQKKVFEEVFVSIDKGEKNV